MTTKQSFNPLYVQKIEKRIALMQAYLAGKEIELRDTENILAGWITVESGVSLEWNFSRFEYRIKIETCIPYRRYLFISPLTHRSTVGIHTYNDHEKQKPETYPEFTRWIDEDYISHSV